ncbi:type I secretion outer membrane protein, TolC family [Oxalobacteraceae bacterium IMCC9480]|nr:type I secretion outer membrane protein, TolC family [Oxalobacteraceae bacterium IMCC9480]NDP58169.1 TolC family outer membrane protein [Oxalobacteraceae bacterium]
MTARARISFSVTVIAAGFLFTGPVSGQSLKAAVEQTLQSNPDVLADANRRLSTDEALKAARGGFLPKVDLGIGTGREWSDNVTTRFAGGTSLLTRNEASLTLNQMLLDGGQVQSEVDRNQARVASSASKLSGTSEQTALRAIEAYLEVLRNRDLVVLTTANADVHLRTFDQIKIRSDSGVGRKADLEQIGARQGLAKANLTSSEANLRDAEINFLRVVGSAPVNLSKVDGPPASLIPASLEAALTTAIDNHPTLKSARADFDAANAQIAGAKAPMSPRLDLQLGATVNSNIDGVPGRNDSRFAMLRLRWNLFNGGSDTARLNETVALSGEAREIMNRTYRQVDQSTRLSWNALTSAQIRMPSLRQHAESSALTRDAYTKQFSIGQRTLLDMLDSENETYTAASNYVNGQYLEVFAKYRVLADMGQLLNALGVAPRPESMLATSGSNITAKN